MMDIPVNETCLHPGCPARTEADNLKEKLQETRRLAKLLLEAHDRIAELEAQLKAAKRDAILEVMGATARCIKTADGKEIDACETGAMYDYANTIGEE